MLIGNNNLLNILIIQNTIILIHLVDDYITKLTKIADHEVIGHIRIEALPGVCEVLIQSNNQATGFKARTMMQFKCDLCDAAYNHESKLQTHRTEEHGININEKDSTNGDINDIMPTVTQSEISVEDVDKKNKYTCTICDKKFR